ncbi:MAG: hypothetical protein K2Y32_16865 [Candidatus Obscuribacterales bacterium]|jgi:hypothetical protein|nr:hypothetical protein [Candidatus Obscuribacterales bacterium]
MTSSLTIHLHGEDIRGMFPQTIINDSSGTASDERSITFQKTVLLAQSWRSQWLPKSSGNE